MSDKRGTILIFTTWILFTLTILSIVVASRASSQLNLAKYEIETLQSTYLAKAALSKMIVELRNDETKGVDSLKEEWNKPKILELDGKEVLYFAMDEERRLNLNGEINTDMLKGLSPDIKDDIANDIIQHKQKKETKGMLGFEVLEELFLIDGITNGIFQEIRDLVTIYREKDSSKININTADGKVLEAIGMDTADVELILSFRRGGDKEDGTEDDEVFTGIPGNIPVALTPEIQNRLSVSSQVFRIRVEVNLPRNRTKHFEIVFNRDTGKILSWKEL